jgi:signal peptidase I
MATAPGTLQILKLLAVVLLMAVTLKIFVLDAVVVSGGSMEETLRPGDFLIVDKTGYAPTGFVRRMLAGPGTLFPFFAGRRIPMKGEVVAFTFTDPARGEDAIIIKRCMASAGDSIGVEGGRLRVNGVAVADLDDPGEFFAQNTHRRVPRAGDLLALDSAGCPLWHDLIAREGHRLETDSRGRPTVDGERSDTYTVERNYIFVMGDNLPASRDSRSWGFLPADRVIGRALLVYWSLAADGSVRWDRVGTFVD